jgi:hypothetical protein
MALWRAGAFPRPRDSNHHCSCMPSALARREAAYLAGVVTGRMIPNPTKGFFGSGRLVSKPGVVSATLPTPKSVLDLKSNGTVNRFSCTGTILDSIRWSEARAVAETHTASPTTKIGCHIPAIYRFIGPQGSKPRPASHRSHLLKGQGSTNKWLRYDEVYAVCLKRKGRQTVPLRAISRNDVSAARKLIALVTTA